MFCIIYNLNLMLLNIFYQLLEIPNNIFLILCLKLLECIKCFKQIVYSYFKNILKHLKAYHFLKIIDIPT